MESTFDTFFLNWKYIILKPLTNLVSHTQSYSEM